MRLSSVLLLTLAGCAGAAGSAPPPAPATVSPGKPVSETAAFVPAGPQSFTPDAKARSRDFAVRQLWAVDVGRTDERTTSFFHDGAVWIGTKAGKHGPAGVYVIDGKTGTRRAVLPAAQGEVVGIAFDGGRVYSTSLEGEVAVTSTTGAVIFRARASSPIVTPPTLVDADGDGVLDIAVGESRGRVTVFDGRTGKASWSRSLGGMIGSGLAAADIDGDGKTEIVAGTDAGGLFAVRAVDGSTLWQTTRGSALRAAPVLCDVDLNGKLEVIAGWYEGDLGIFAGATGKALWSQRVEEDGGEKTGIVASPTPLPGGTLLVPTARHGKDDAVLFVKAHDRAFRSREGSVFASPVLGTVRATGNRVEAVVGTDNGEVYSFDAAGGASYLYRLEGSLAAPALLADIENNGIVELVVATREGRLVALGIHASVPPFAGVPRGTSRHNDGVLPPIDLEWKL